MVTQLKRKLRLGSDCSGMGTDTYAARAAGLVFENVFASDSDAACRLVLRDGPDPPQHLYESAGKGYQCGQLDLYTCGFPCQPFSSAGKNKGSDDKRNLDCCGKGCSSPVSPLTLKIRFRSGWAIKIRS